MRSAAMCCECLRILEDHCDDFAEIGVKLFERLALGVRARKARDVADEETSVGTTLDDSSETPHRYDLGLALKERL